MPTYTYECSSKECGAVIDFIIPIALRNDPQDCPRCGAFMSRNFVSPFSFKVFQPYYSEALGAHIGSTQDYKSILKARGGEEIGNEIDTALRMTTHTPPKVGITEEAFKTAVEKTEAKVGRIDWDK